MPEMPLPSRGTLTLSSPSGRPSLCAGRWPRDAEKGGGRRSRPFRVAKMLTPPLPRKLNKLIMMRALSYEIRLMALRIGHGPDSCPLSPAHWERGARG